MKGLRYRQKWRKRQKWTFYRRTSWIKWVFIDFSLQFAKFCISESQKTNRNDGEAEEKRWEKAETQRKENGGKWRRRWVRRGGNGTAARCWSEFSFKLGKNWAKTLNFHFSAAKPAKTALGSYESCAKSCGKARIEQIFPEEAVQRVYGRSVV